MVKFKENVKDYQDSRMVASQMRQVVSVDNLFNQFENLSIYVKKQHHRSFLFLSSMSFQSRLKKNKDKNLSYVLSFLVKLTVVSEHKCVVLILS